MLISQSGNADSGLGDPLSFTSPLPQPWVTRGVSPLLFAIFLLGCGLGWRRRKALEPSWHQQHRRSSGMESEALDVYNYARWNQNNSSTIFKDRLEENGISVGSLSLPFFCCCCCCCCWMVVVIVGFGLLQWLWCNNNYQLQKVMMA